MQKLKAVSNRYKIQKKLFTVNTYLYARIFDKCTLDTSIGCVYIYENQQPGQTLKMISQKFTPSQNLPNLIFPSFHVKDNYNDKSISIFFMTHKIVPLQIFKESQYQAIDINQMLKFTYDSLCSLHHLHSHNIVHGNISLTTSYISKNKKNVDFALNILDTLIFHEELLKIQESLLFKSQSQHNGLKTSFKDDAQSIIYVLLHIISKGKMFTQYRYKTQWVNQNQLLRWKTTDFFKQMVQVLPQELQFIGQIYIDIKSMTRLQKPDYSKYVKRAYTKMKQMQSIQKKKTYQQFEDFQQKQNIKQKQSIELDINKSLKNLSDPKQINKQINFNNIEEEEILLIMDEEEQSSSIKSKFLKLDSTNIKFKSKKFNVDFNI